MGNKVFKIIALFVLNSIVISLCTSFYVGFIADADNLTNINKDNHIINISGY